MAKFWVMTGVLAAAMAGCGGSGKKQPEMKATPVVADPGTGGGGTPEPSPTAEPAVGKNAAGDGTQKGPGEPDSFAVAEMDEFHKVLHPLWHDLKVQKDWAGICKAAAGLAKSAAAVKIAKVPANLKDRQARYTPLAEKLSDRAEDLRDTCNPSKGEDVEEQLVKVHNAFHDLMQLMQ